MVEPWSDTRAGQERLNLTEDAGTRRACAGAVTALCSPSGLARGITAIRLVVQQDDPEDTAASCENSCPNAHPDSYAGSHRGCALAGAGTAMLAGAAAIVMWLGTRALLCASITTDALLGGSVSRAAG